MRVIYRGGPADDGRWHDRPDLDAVPAVDRLHHVQRTATGTTRATYRREAWDDRFDAWVFYVQQD